MKITMAHGSGGSATTEIIRDIFAGAYGNTTLNAMEDAAVVEGANRIAFTTDSFVVKPVFFPGGDIGHLAVCGTVNDMLMRGSTPRYLTSAFIIEEGMDIDELKQIASSMAKTCAEAGVNIVCGDTKVVEFGSREGDKPGVFINTAGVGFVDESIDISATNCAAGDVIIASGFMGDHHAAILSARMGIANDIISDCAPLSDIVANLLSADLHIHALRDVTRGGLATVIKELAVDSGVTIELEDSKIPVRESVRDFCGLMGLDPYYMGNEGKLVCVLPEAEADKALEVIRSSRYGENAAIIGRVTDEEAGLALAKTVLGTRRILDLMYGEGLPRIC